MPTPAARATFRRRPVATLLVALPVVWVLAVVGGLYVSLGRLAVSWSVGSDVWFLGRDYAVFYTGGILARQGSWSILYDLASFTDRFNTATGLSLPAGGPVFRYPPPSAFAFVPLTSLSLGASLAVWTVLGVAAYAVAVKLLRLPPVATFLAMISVPAYGAIALGQNTLVFCLVFAAAAVAARRGRPLWVGLTLGLLVLKPQLALGPAVWWLTSPPRHRRELTGALVSGGSLIAASVVAAPEAWPTYLARLPSLADPGPTNRVWYLSGLDFFRMLLGDDLAGIAWLLLGLLILVGAVALFRRLGDDPELGLAVAVIVSLLITPHVVVYDWLLLVVSGAILWRRIPALRGRLIAGAVLIDLVALTGPDLTTWQLDRFGMGLHPAYPILLLTSAVILARLPASRQAGPESAEGEPDGTAELTDLPSPT